MKTRAYKIRVQVYKRGAFESFVLPRCENAERFCQIAQVPYLNSSQLFLIQKLGFEIELVEENNLHKDQEYV